MIFIWMLWCTCYISKHPKFNIAGWGSGWVFLKIVGDFEKATWNLKAFHHLSEESNGSHRKFALLKIHPLFECPSQDRHTWIDWTSTFSWKKWHWRFPFNFLTKSKAGFKILLNEDASVGGHQYPLNRKGGGFLHGRSMDPIVVDSDPCLAEAFLDSIRAADQRRRSLCGSR